MILDAKFTEQNHVLNADAGVVTEVGTEVFNLDDSSVRTDTTWSSRNIVDRLCPSFEESGSVVACEPVEGYPLEVESKIIPKQSGSGDPSPENVRPIESWTGAKLWHSGKNIWSGDSVIWSTDSDLEGTREIVGLPANTPITLSADITKYADDTATNTRMTFICWYTDDTFDYISSAMDYENVERDGVARRKCVTLTSNPNKSILKWTIAPLAYSVCDGTRNAKAENIQLEIGSVATEYEPYQGEEITIDFGQAVYGGSYNWKTGLLTDSMVHSVLTGTENWNALGSSWQGAGKFGCYASMLEQSTKSFDYKPSYSELPCSHCIPGNWGWGSATETGLLLLSNKVVYLSFSKTALGITDADSDAEMVEKFKAYLVGQYANGTPVEFCYVPTAEPTTAQLTPQEILALSGVNTLYTDTGDTTVSGRADTSAVIEKLTNAILALGGNV